MAEFERYYFFYDIPRLANMEIRPSQWEPTKKGAFYIIDNDEAPALNNYVEH